MLKKLHTISLNKNCFHSWLKTEMFIQAFLSYLNLFLISFLNWTSYPFTFLVTRTISLNRPIDHINDEIRSNQKRTIEKFLLQKHNEFATLAINLKYKQLFVLQIQIKADVKSIRVYLPLYFLKFCLQLVLFRHKITKYHCKLLQKPFQLMLILKGVQMYLKQLHLKIISLILLMTSFNSKDCNVTISALW